MQNHILLGPFVSDLLDERLSGDEFADNPLATLLLIVMEQNLAEEIEEKGNDGGKVDIWDDVTFFARIFHFLLFFFWLLQSSYEFSLCLNCQH